MNIKMYIYNEFHERDLREYIKGYRQLWTKLFK